MDNITARVTEHGDYGYSYDELYRLIGSDNPVQADEGFSYDAVGNRLTAEGVADDWSYNDDNELRGYGGTSFEYDDNGNMTQKTDGGQVTSYIYNVEDRLERVEDGSGSLISTYYYDPFGRRLWKEVGGVRTYFVYADEGLVAEVDGSGNVVKSYGYRPGSTWTTDPLFMKVGGQYYFYQNDHLGTPQKMTAVNGAVVWSAKYSSFGDADVDLSSTVTNNLRFPGQYLDQETGLHYNRYRYYDRKAGRFLRKDPIGINGGSNQFAYAGNDPIGIYDNLGLKSRNGIRVIISRPIHDVELGAPGDTDPRPGDIPRFVGESFGELADYTLFYFGREASGELTRDFRRLVSEEEWEIGCRKEIKYRFCFQVSNFGVSGRFVNREGVDYYSNSDTQCVPITIVGRKGCGSCPFLNDRQSQKKENWDLLLENLQNRSVQRVLNRMEKDLLDNTVP